MKNASQLTEILDHLNKLPSGIIGEIASHLGFKDKNALYQVSKNINGFFNNLNHCEFKKFKFQSYKERSKSDFLLRNELQLAIFNEDVESAKMIIGCYDMSQLNHKDSSGKAALHHCVARLNINPSKLGFNFGMLALCHLLIDKGVDTQVLDKNNDKPIDHLPINLKKNKHPDIEKLLNKLKCHIPIASSENYLGLHK